MPSKNDWEELLTLDTFNGIDASTQQVKLDLTKAIDAVNVVPDRNYLGYVTAQGRASAIASPLVSKPYGLAKFDRAGFPTIYVAFVDFGGVPEVAGLQYFQLGGAPTTLSLPPGATLSLLSGTFAKAGKWLFFSPQGQFDTPLKIAYDTLQVTNWGIAPPTNAVSVAAGGSGNLDFADYQYLVTFGVSLAGETIQESSPGPASAHVSFTNQRASLSNIPVSSDPQVNERNIYRLDSGGQFRLVGTINDNTTTTFVDNTADASVTGQVLVVHRDPPKPFFAIIEHQDAVWGFGYSSSDPRTMSDLWNSNYTEPWGFDEANQVIPVGENAGADVAVALASTGTVLACLKSKSFWIVLGTPGNYVPPIFSFNIGCASQRSVVSEQGVIYWLSPDAGVYSWNGSAPTYLSRDIETYLTALALADLQVAVGFFRNRCYYLSFPTKNITWLYDTQQNSWWKLGFSTDIVAYDSQNLGEVTASDSQSPGAIETWFAAETDLGLPITSSITSRIFGSDKPEATKQYRKAVILAPPQNATATLTVIADPGFRQRVATRTVSLNSPPSAAEISLPGWMQGREAQIVLTVTASQKVQVQKISLYGWVRRRFGQTG